MFLAGVHRDGRRPRLHLRAGVGPRARSAAGVSAARHRQLLRWSGVDTGRSHGAARRAVRPSVVRCGHGAGAPAGRGGWAAAGGDSRLIPPWHPIPPVTSRKRGTTATVAATVRMNTRPSTKGFAVTTTCRSPPRGCSREEGRCFSRSRRSSPSVHHGSFLRSRSGAHRRHGSASSRPRICRNCGLSTIASMATPAR